jgi:hypothetical protein
MRAYISHREQIKRHCLEAFAGGFRSKKLAGGCAGSSTTHNDLIAIWYIDDLHDTVGQSSAHATGGFR